MVRHAIFPRLPAHGHPSGADSSIVGICRCHCRQEYRKKDVEGAERDPADIACNSWTDDDPEDERRG